MFTPSNISAWTAIQSRIENSNEYNWYVHNIGYSGVLDMYGLNKIKTAATDKSKSREYNLINKEYVGVIREIEDFKRSLQNSIKDLQRKIRDIDRLNPNNYEDWNSTMTTYGEFKTKELNAIVQKATFIKNKHDTLMKITKMENDEKGGGGGIGGGSPLDTMARLLGQLPKNGGGPTPQQYSPQSIVDPAITSGATPTMDYETVKTAEAGQVSARIRESLVTYQGQDIGSASNGVTIDPYTVALTRHGVESIKERYCVDPKTGFGYVEFETPAGEKGIKHTPVRNFQESYIDYSNKSVVDKVRKSYEIVEVDSIPPEIEKQWNEVYEGHNRLGVKK